MEKWRCRGKNPAKCEIDPIIYQDTPREKKKNRKWSLGGLLKRKTKNEGIMPVSNTNTNIDNGSELNFQKLQQPFNRSLNENKMSYQAAIKMVYHQKPINNIQSSSHESQDSINIHNASLHSRNSESSLDVFGRSSRRNRIKARLQAKRKQLNGHSSSDDENKSNNSLAKITNDDLQNIQKYDINKRTRGARTERYMKRLYREDTNSGNDGEIKNSPDHPLLINRKKKNSSATMSPNLWTKNNDLQLQLYQKSPTLYYQSYCSEQNIVNVLPSKSIIHPTDLHDNERVCGDKRTWPQTRSRIMPINDSNKSHGTYITSANKVLPPEPPPRSSKSRLFTGSLRLSLQNSDIENTNMQYDKSFNNVNSLDRMSSGNNYSLEKNNEVASRYPFDYYQLQQNRSSDIDCISPEAPIIPCMKYQQKIAIKPNIELNNKRHSKNLEEALQELETIYNSLRLNDEDLMDRAEQRSMEEYRDKLATTAGSIKSSSDTSSSYEMSRELGWRHASFDRSCHDTRLKDDMAYRRMHQNERSSSVDPSQTSLLSRISYLATSPSIFNREIDYYSDRPKSRRGTPDLTRDDVVFRSIHHANNTLKVVEPQPPFGIPLGPVTTAVESDYLHVEPSKVHSRSLYIPQTEPDIVTDDLAFRNLRKETKDKSPVNNFFFPNNTPTPELKKKRAVRSLSADLYGIINKNSDSQHAWYKEYVKLNRPLKLGADDDDDDDDNDDNDGYYDNDNEKKNENSSAWFSNREYCDLDINGNRPKSTYKGRVQVCVPEDERIIEKKSINLKIFTNNNTRRPLSSSTSPSRESINISPNNIKPFTDHELSEYKQLCRDLESLINKTSEKVKSVDIKSDEESRKSSLAEFVEWEELLGKTDTLPENNVVDEALKSSEIDIKEVNLGSSEAGENHEELLKTKKNLLPLIETDIKPNDDYEQVASTNKYKELNSTNQVPYKSSTINTNNIINNEANNSAEDNETSINEDLKEDNENKEATKTINCHSENSNSTLVDEKNCDDDSLAAVKSYSTTSLTLNDKNDDGGHESPMFEGRETSL